MRVTDCDIYHGSIVYLESMRFLHQRRRTVHWLLIRLGTEVAQEGFSQSVRLALEQGNIMSFENHELWAESLFTSRLRDVPQGYSKISFKQIQAADAKLFVVLGEMTRGGIKMTSKRRPCDEIFKAAMQSNQVQHLLQPLPISNPGKTPNPNRDRSRSPPNLKGKGKGKNGKDKSNKWKPAVPRELLQLGCVGTTSGGEPLCYDFQLGRCALKNCQKDHAATACPSKKPTSHLWR